MAGTAVVPRETGDRTGLGQLVETARAYADAGMADNTRRAYGADWRAFTSWCASVGVCPLPAEAATLALYLTARAPELAASTLARHLAAIRTAHRAADQPVPDSAALRGIWKGIRKKFGRPARKKRALVTEDLRRVVKRRPETLIGTRDRALLLLGFASALRRSELAGLELSGLLNGPLILEFVVDGIEIHVGRSKGDQLGKGAVVAVPYGKTANCPVSAVRAWLETAKIREGAVFRGVDRHGRIAPGALSAGAVARIVKRSAAAAGMDPAAFAGHSLRRGSITSASRGGAAPKELQAHARHAKFEQTLGYIEEADRFKNAAAGKVGL